MSPLVQYVRRSNVTGVVALLFAGAVVVLALCAAGAAIAGNLNGAKEIASTMALLIGVVGALLAAPAPHGRPTDPSPQADP